MGLSVSAASAVLATGFVLMTIILVDGYTHSYQELDEASGDRSDRERELLDTAVEIGSTLHNNTTKILTISVTNGGSSVLDPEEVDVVVDGILLTGNITALEVDGTPAQAWFPGKTLAVELTIADPPVRVKVVTGNGVADYTEDISALP